MPKRSWNYSCSILHKHFLFLFFFFLGGGGCKQGVLWAMWKLWIASCYSHCSLWHQVPGCPHDVMDKLLNLTDKLRSSKDPTVRWCFLVFNLLDFCPSHYTETPFKRVQTNFWSDEFFVCVTRLNETLQILLLYRLHESVQIFAPVSIRMDFFLSKARNPGQNILGHSRKFGAEVHFTK